MTSPNATDPKAGDTVRIVFVTYPRQLVMPKE
jgi:hypothetical protein